MEGQKPFPSEPEDFVEDDRIKYDPLTRKYHLHDATGQIWEFLDNGHWRVTISDEDVRKFQAGYGGHVEQTEDEIAEDRRANKKRKAEQVKESKKVRKVQENRGIYITGLPLDATFEEIEEVVTRYGGMIAEGSNGKKRIKLYDDAAGNPKGEALIIFFQSASVPLAINLLDGRPLRYNDPMLMSVTPADASYKKATVPGAEIRGQDKRKLIEALHKQKAKLADWDDDDVSSITQPVSKWDKTVILRNMFTLHKLDENPSEITDITVDVRSAGEDFGQVTNVVVYDREPQGIVSVRFKDVTSVAPFVRTMDGRLYDGRLISARVAGCKLKFKKSGQGTESDEEEEAQRIENFGIKRKRKPYRGRQPYWNWLLNRYIVKLRYLRNRK